jgi:hypothetical protein
VPGFCEDGNEPSGSINAESFHELRREFYPVRSGGFCSPITGQAREPLYRTLIGVRLGLVMVRHRSGTPRALYDAVNKCWALGATLSTPNFVCMGIVRLYQ